MGESVAETTITTWLKSVGDSIEEDEPIVEIAQIKDSEVPSPCSGKLKEILFKEGDVVPVGSVFAIIDSDSNITANEVEQLTTEKSLGELTENDNQKLEEEILKPIIENNQKSNEIIFKSSNKFYSPLVKSIAKKENISFEELENISGTGAKDRITKSDILSYLNNRKKSNIETVEKSTTASKIVSKPSDSGNDEIITMDRMRK